MPSPFLWRGIKISVPCDFGELVAMYHAAKFMTPFVKYYSKARFIQFRQGIFPREVRDRYMLEWSQETLEKTGIRIHSHGKPDSRAGVLVGNHISYLDIPLILSQIPVVFLSKAELLSWPLIGGAAKIANVIFVDRTSRSSRLRSIDGIIKKINDDRERVVIFPSGTTSLKEHKRWSPGAFKIAKKYGVPMQAVRLRYDPMDRAAFINDDLFLPHLNRLCRSNGADAHIEFSEPFFVDDVQEELLRVQSWCNEIL
ncbi:MAG: 1-acyl-sn-glycerol-3-phosphate acyltransferase [Oligoflexales bacterium]|nr:1-acyl-sn-glycerol-3-phosphate acyltransferase [Oligoflexales bacterium]